MSLPSSTSLLFPDPCRRAFFLQDPSFSGAHFGTREIIMCDPLRRPPLDSIPVSLITLSSSTQRPNRPIYLLPCDTCSPWPGWIPLTCFAATAFIGLAPFAEVTIPFLFFMAFPHAEVETKVGRQWIAFFFLRCFRPSLKPVPPSLPFLSSDAGGSMTPAVEWFLLAAPRLHIFSPNWYPPCPIGYPFFSFRRPDHTPEECEVFFSLTLVVMFSSSTRGLSGLSS